MRPLDKLLRVYVAENDTTMQCVAEQLGMTKDTILSRRKGRVELSFKDARNISNLLGITLDELADAIL